MVGSQEWAVGRVEASELLGIHWAGWIKHTVINSDEMILIAFGQPLAIRLSQISQTLQLVSSSQSTKT